VKLYFHHWILGFCLAIGAHALAFAAMGSYEQPAMIERASGPVLSVAGSLTNFSADADMSKPEEATEVETTEQVNELEPETVEEEVVETIEDVEPDIIPEVEPDMALETVASTEPKPVEVEEVIPTEVIKQKKTPKAKPRKIREKIKRKVKKKVIKRKSKAKPSKKRRIARRGGSRTRAGQRGGGGGGRQSVVAGRATISDFKGRVRARIAGRVRSAKGRGTVIVRFTVTSGGGVTGVRIVRSASAALNSAALRAVRGGFPPIPYGGPRRMTFTIPISFR
jgi:protein TonB